MFAVGTGLGVATIIVAFGVFVGLGVAVGDPEGEGTSVGAGAVVTTAAGVAATLAKCLITLYPPYATTTKAISPTIHQVVLFMTIDNYYHTVTKMQHPNAALYFNFFFEAF